MRFVGALALCACSGRGDRTAAAEQELLGQLFGGSFYGEHDPPPDAPGPLPDAGPGPWPSPDGGPGPWPWPDGGPPPDGGPGGGDSGDDDDDDDGTRGGHEPQTYCDAAGVCAVGTWSMDPMPSCDGGAAAGSGAAAMAAGSGEPMECAPDVEPMQKVTARMNDTQTHTRTTTKAFKTQYTVNVGPLQKSGDNLQNVTTKIEQTIIGYFSIDTKIPVATIQAHGNKPLVAEDGTLNYDVPVTCGAQTKLVNTKITAEGDVASFAVGLGASLKLVEAGGGIQGPDSTLLGFSVNAQKTTTVDHGKTAELSIDVSAERTLALQRGDNPMKKCQEKHFLKDAWGPSQNLMQWVADSAANFLSAHGTYWSLTSTTPVSCQCTVDVKTAGSCRYTRRDGTVGVPTGPAGWWVGPWPGAVRAVVQQFDEAAILGCAGFSQGDKRPSVVNGLVEQCRAFNRETHDGLDTMVKNRCNANPGSPYYDIGRFFKVCDKIADSAITCSVQPH